MRLGELITAAAVVVFLSVCAGSYLTPIVATADQSFAARATDKSAVAIGETCGGGRDSCWQRLLRLAGEYKGPCGGCVRDKDGDETCCSKSERPFCEDGGTPCYCKADVQCTDKDESDSST